MRHSSLTQQRASWSCAFDFWDCDYVLSFSIQGPNLLQKTGDYERILFIQPLVKVMVYKVFESTKKFHKNVTNDKNKRKFHGQDIIPLLFLTKDQKQGTDLFVFLLSQKLSSVYVVVSSWGLGIIWIVDTSHGLAVHQQLECISCTPGAPLTIQSYTKEIQFMHFMTHFMKQLKEWFSGHTEFCREGSLLSPPQLPTTVMSNDGKY